MSNKKQSHIKLETKFNNNVDATNVKEYLQQAIEITWKDGSNIDKVVINDKKVDISKFNKVVVHETKNIDQ